MGMWRRDLWFYQEEKRSKFFFFSFFFLCSVGFDMYDKIYDKVFQVGAHCLILILVFGENDDSVLKFEAFFF